MSNNILKARDIRHTHIKQLLNKDNLVVLVKANTPGKNKNTSEAHFLVRFFSLEIKKSFKLTNKLDFDSDDGPYFLASINNANASSVKKDCIEIEDSHPLGRFIDIDVFSKAKQSLSRFSNNIKSRKCYLCDESAFYCARNKTHSIDLLTQFMKKNIISYLNTIIESLIKDSMLKELSLEHKFGLVTKTSSGSHTDMGYSLMIKAQKVITPHLVSLFSLGYNATSLDNLLDESRHIGLRAEKDMLEKTKGVNCYKGLIFVLGITILSIGFTLKSNLPFIDIFTNIKKISHIIEQEFKQVPNSFGLKAYQKYQLKGVRGEVHQGLPSVQSALKIASYKTDNELREVLRHLIISCEDTVLLKRSGNINSYFEVKKQIANLNLSCEAEAKTYTRYAIDKNLSFGGSADLLVVTIFLKLVKNLNLLSDLK